jgi:hypothetical protein
MSYRDGEGGLGSGLDVDPAVGEENGSSADADTGFTAKEQTLPAPPKQCDGIEIDRFLRKLIRRNRINFACFALLV